MLSLNSLTDQICGVLHDVVEDADVTLDGLREQGFNDEVIEVLDLLTRRDGDTYDKFIDRLLCNPIACSVKLSDLKDNMNLERLKLLDKDVHLRLIQKYGNAHNKIARHMVSGVFDKKEN